ncbi:ParM/StbA family protein [Paenibacillus lutrae]|uniref:Actin-like protein N-terminal domain-containing protein n=1 Tax=Paenibacillus lutrae TaxID=2078573 RepID=A0A7X3K1B3_9BACL|nr:ParM/StbA family protein [Paenibacillus lutrae]MVP02139.1 hypothetical protein [Paenibacillus lutrae]
MAAEKAIHLEIGNDIGNSAHKIVINGEPARVQPACFVKVSKALFDDEVTEESVIKDIWNQLCVSINSVAAENAMYVIGRKAIDSGRPLINLEVGLDKKSTHDLPVVNTLANIAAYVIETNQKDGILAKDSFNVTVDMGTAIPVTQFTDEAARLLEKRFMEGKHRVTVYLGSRKQVFIEITFAFTRCTKEGTPPTFAIQYDKNGAIRNDSIFERINKLRETKDLPPIDGSHFQNKRILHLDIGDGTSELPITEGNKPIFVHGINHGVGHALEEALFQFNVSINIPDSPRQYLSDVIKNKSHKYHARALSAVKTPLDQEIPHFVKGVNDQIKKARGEIDVLMIYGGGSILSYPELEERLQPICEEREMELFYVPAEYAVDMNADGLYIFVKSPIFQNLKKKYLETVAS